MDPTAGLSDTLLRRANQHDFPRHGTGFVSVAEVLENTLPSAKGLVPAFLDAICDSSWLNGQFTEAPLNSLTSGLRILALRQSPEIQRRFRNPGLGIRLQKELSYFHEASRRKQSEIIRFLGCATLFGWHASSSWVTDVTISALSKLPMDTLPHEPDAQSVQSRQFELWLGLRAVTALMNTPLDVPLPTIIKTLDLWRCNLAETASHTNSAEHLVNENMIRWLESCAGRINMWNMLLPVPDRIAACKAVLAEAPNDVQANYCMGRTTLEQLKDASAAEPWLGAATQLNPNDSNIRRCYGQALERLGRWNEALAELDRITDAFADNSEFHNARANCLKELKLYADAEIAYRKAISAARPLYAAKYLNNLVLLFSVWPDDSRLDEGLGLCDRLAREFPQFRWTSQTRAVLLSRMS